MTFSNRSIIVCFIILLSLISVGCGQLRISACTGDSSGSAMYGETLGANINDKIHENTALIGSSLSQSFSGNGNRAETFSVTNNAGDHAEVGFDIKNSNSYSGSYTLSPKTATNAKATEKLNAIAADSIHAFANANSRDGNTAGSGVDVTKGSLTGYTNSAYATLGNAKTTQSWSDASGDVVTLGCGANNFEGDTARAIIDNGDLDGIIGSIKTFSSTSEAKKSMVSATQNAKSIQGNYYIDAIGQNQLHNSAGTFATIQGTTTNHMSTATATKYNTDATFSATNIYGSGSIWTDSYVDYTNPNTWTTVNTNWMNGIVKSYSNGAKAKGNSVESTQKFASALGDLISANTHAENLAGNQANLQINVIKGSIANYKDLSVATPISATSKLSFN